MNTSTCRFSFQIMYGSSPRTTPKLRKMEKGERTSAEAEYFVEHVKNLHEEVRAHITKMNLQYKDQVDQKRRHQGVPSWGSSYGIFEEGTISSGYLQQAKDE